MKFEKILEVLNIYHISMTASEKNKQTNKQKTNKQQQQQNTLTSRIWIWDLWFTNGVQYSTAFL